MSIRLMFEVLLISVFQLTTAKTYLPWMLRPTTRHFTTTPPPINSCQGTTVLRGSTGVISSPNYPRNYPSRSDCRWKIVAPPGSKFIMLQFHHFHLESSSSCSYDYVEIRNGGSPSSPALAKLCGRKTNPFVTSSGPMMYIRFRSDGTVVYKGFTAVWRAGTNMQDLCDKSWKHHGNSSYKVCPYRTSWIGALKMCQNMGADLVKIETDQENTFLFNLQRHKPNFWIGLTRGPDNRFYWTDGKRPGYTNWANREPNNVKEEEDCVHFHKGHKTWNDLRCNRPPISIPSFVCETPKCKKTPLLKSNSIITALSVRDSNHSATHGLLTNSSSSIWCPQSNSTIEWLEVDLGAPFIVCGLAAVNDVSVANRSSVTWYRTFTSLSPFTEDPETGNNTMQALRTDVNQSTTVIHEYRRLARYIRFVPLRSVNWPCLKVRVYGDRTVLPLKIVIPLMNKTEEHASTMELRCIASGHPFLSYSWTRNGSSSIQNGVLTEENTVLRISAVDWEDEGLYTCSATNSLGSVSSSAYLAVHIKPKALKFQPFINGLTGSDVVLSCESTAHPIPNVTWINDNIDLWSGKYSISTALIPGTNKIVTNITVRNVSIYDMGYYKCRFWNVHGSIEGTITLEVVDGCSDTVFDFEDGASSLTDWGRTGTAFNNQPTYGDNVKARRNDMVANNQGDYWIGTAENCPNNSTPPGLLAGRTGDEPQGSIISPEFQITGSYASFFVGGGCHRSNTAVQLLVGGHVLLSAKGRCHERMTKKTWNLRSYIGRKARLRLIDFSSGGWGHINFDDFRGNISTCQGCVQPLGMTTGKIPDFAVTASTSWSNRHAPKYARLYTLNRDGHKSTWSSKWNRIGEWIQVDLGTVVMVTKIATQGRTQYAQWVRKYTIRYSVNGTKFEQYQNSKLLMGNSDRETIVENYLLPPIKGRFIRVYPQSWYNHISMRIELYGCPPRPESPKIYGLPKKITPVKGSDVSLVCLADGFPYINFRWIKGGPGNKITRMASGQSLVFTNVSESDSRVYTCIASNLVGNESHDVWLDVQNAPSVTQGMLKSKVTITGKTETLVCKAKGNPPPLAVWFKNGHKIKERSKLKISSSVSMNKLVSTTLTIQDVEYGDKGVYTCEFRNTLGVINSTGTLVVHGPPQFILIPKTQAIVKGDDVKLSCAATAIPTPQIRWKLRGNYLRQDPKFVHDGTNLVIKNAENSPLLEGNYTCEASNSVGKIFSFFQLTIYERPWLRNLPRKSINVAQGQGAVLHCSPVGDPTPELEWRKDGVALESSKQILFHSEKEILFLQNLRREDSGLYQCFARNIVGNVTSATNISVFGEPKIDTILTRNKVYTLLGNPANLMCLATNPLPVRYSWTKDGQPIGDSANIQIHKNILVVNPRTPRDFGPYVCNASNIAGSTSYTIELVDRERQNIYSAKSQRESPGPSVSTWVPLVVVVTVLLVAVLVLGYRYVQLKRQTSHSKLDSIGLVTYDKHREEPLIADEFAG